MGEDLGRRLDSWKQIAEYVGRDVRTAIRWEDQRGLPVHRVPGGKRGSVFAYTEEIERWLARRPLDGPSPDLAPRSPAGPGAGPAEAGASATPRLAEARGAPRWPWFGVTVLSLAGVLLVSGLVVLWARRSARGSIGPDRLDHLEFGPRQVVARTEAGEAAWRYEFPDRLFQWQDEQDSRYAIADVDDDGEEEVVATVTHQPRADLTQEELVCFSHRGEVKWRTRLEDRVTFRGGTFGPPWTRGHVIVYRLAGRARIAWSQGHHTWWPGMLTTFDGAGRRLGTFVNAGQIWSLAALEGADRPLLLVGGINNGRRSASLAVLDGASVGGRSPEPAGTPYECTSCGEGSPLRYLLFPPSEILTASDYPYNHTRSARTVGDEIEVLTRESLPGAPVAELVFRFSRDFRLLEARAADSWAAHEALERAGRLDHSVADCPMYRTPPPVREWTPDHGWRNLTPPTPALARR